MRLTHYKAGNPHVEIDNWLVVAIRLGVSCGCRAIINFRSMAACDGLLSQATSEHGSNMQS